MEHRAQIVSYQRTSKCFLLKRNICPELQKMKALCLECPNPVAYEICLECTECFIEVDVKIFRSLIIQDTLN